MNDQNQNFMDKNTIIAIIFVGTCWIAWQSYMKSKYPDAYKNKAQTEQTATSGAGSEQASEGQTTQTAANNTLEAAQAEATAQNKAAAVSLEEKTLKFENEIYSFDVSSKGMSLKNITLKNYTTRSNDLIKIGGEKSVSPFETNIVGRRAKLDFDLKQTQDHQFTGTAQIDGMTLTKTISINPSDYSISTKVRVSNVSPNFEGIVTYLVDNLEKYDSGFFLIPSYEHQEFFVKYDGTDDRLMINPDESDIQSYSKMNVVSVGSQYFASAMLDKSAISPDVKTIVDPVTQAVSAKITHPYIGTNDTFEASYVSYAGPKGYDNLKNVDESFVEVLNYGWFSSIGLWILKLLRYLNSVVGNWGISIIILTIIIRLLVLPLYIMSLKSTKKMQAIQPELKSLREKYKDDPQRMNMEVMTLMRENKANPVGGCLPMLLQFPIFIALYQVIGQSIELYQAPFALWITDLSLKDPYYIFPALTGLTIFLQQKLTPTAMDPAQQKVLMFMPIIFTLFMVTIPSAVTLYILVSSLTAVIQQIVFMKEKKTQPVMA